MTTDRTFGAHRMLAARRFGCALLVVALGVSQARAAEDRAVQLHLSATIIEPESGNVSISWNDLLSDEFPGEQVAAESECVGQAHAGVALSYAKIPDNAFVVQGEVRLFKGRHCKANIVARRVVEPTTVARDAEVVIPIDISSNRGDRLLGMLTLRNAAPSCRATHVRWRAHMYIVDHDDWSADEHGNFDSSQVSALLEPDETINLKMYRIVDGETAGLLGSSLTATANHDVNVRSVLNLGEWGSLFEFIEGNTVDATASDSTVLPAGASRNISMSARDAGSVSVTMTVENRGRPRSRWCYFLDARNYLAPLLRDIGPILWARTDCGTTLVGCYSRADRAGWIRIDDVTCTGSGLASQCVVRGAGSGLICPGASWTFGNGVPDADCMGVRFVPSCLPNDAAVLRLGAGGATIRRASRTGETALVVGGTCQ